MDKLIAASASMAAALYFLSCCIAWYRLFSPTYRNPALKIVVDRAIAWTAMAVIFLRIALVRLGVIDWDNQLLDVILLVSLIAVWVCGLCGVRSFTSLRFGARIWLSVALLSLAAGTLVLTV